MASVPSHLLRSTPTTIRHGRSVLGRGYAYSTASNDGATKSTKPARPRKGIPLAEDLGGVTVVRNKGENPKRKNSEFLSTILMLKRKGLMGDVLEDGRGQPRPQRQPSSNYTGDRRPRQEGRRRLDRPTGSDSATTTARVRSNEPRAGFNAPHKKPSRDGISGSFVEMLDGVLANGTTQAKQTSNPSKRGDSVRSRQQASEQRRPQRSSDNRPGNRPPRNPRDKASTPNAKAKSDGTKKNTTPAKQAGQTEDIENFLMGTKGDSEPSARLISPEFVELDAVFKPSTRKSTETAFSKPAPVTVTPVDVLATSDYSALIVIPPKSNTGLHGIVDYARHAISKHPGLDLSNRERAVAVVQRMTQMAASTKNSVEKTS